MNIWDIVRYAVIGVTGVGVSFSLWRRMRPEYEQEKILSLFLVVFLSFMGGGILGGWLVDGRWSWWSGLGVLTGILALVRITSGLKWDVWEWWDELVQTGLGWGTVINLLEGKWLNAIFLCCGVIFVKWINNNYRKFRWYISGRLGLVGLAGVTWWLGSLLVVAFFEPGKIYWFGLTPNFWLAISGIPIVIVIGYRRSGRRLSQDIRIWPKRKTR